MPTLLVTSVGKTKKGRDKVSCGNDEYMLGDKCSVPPVGAKIDADTSESSFPGSNGKTVTLWWLNDWELAGDQPAPVQVAQIKQQATESASSNDKFRNDEAMLRFVSNVVGNGLAALKISTPNDIAPWAAAAHRAGLAVLSGKVKDFSDDIPY